MDYVEMKPPIGDSIGLISPGCGSMGTMMLCERFEEGSAPADALASWKDVDGFYCIRAQIPPRAGNYPMGDTSPGRFYDAGTSAGAWEVSPNIICKVKAWIEGMELEADTIAFVNKNAPSVPTPETIYTWIDHAWQRSFLIMRRVPGVRLNEIWPRLSSKQIKGVATELAQHTTTLAKLTSPRCERATRVCVQRSENLLPSWNQYERPTWLPYLQPERFTPATLTDFLTERGGIAPPHINGKFHYYHSDQGPTNVFISEPSDENDMPHVTAIIDWETASYFPHWWIGTMPRFNDNFGLDVIEDCPDRWDWMWILSDALIEEGFECEWHWYEQFQEGFSRIKQSRANVSNQE